MSHTITDDELESWANNRADDAGKLARELIAHRRAAATIDDAIKWAEGFCKEVGCLADTTHLKTLIAVASRRVNE